MEGPAATPCLDCQRLRAQLEELQATVAQLQDQLAQARKGPSTSSEPPEPPPSGAEAELPRPKAEPVQGAERVASVDVLRGVAVLGILAMNVVFFGLPGPAYDNPTRGGGDTGLNLGLWAFNHLVFDAKMMTLFSMLFGAGLVLMGGRADARGARLGWVYYRRVFWLLVIGALHAYLLWAGDILFVYALCGLLLYPFRRLSPRTLLIVGTLVMLVLLPVGAGIEGGLRFLKATAAKAEAVRQEAVPNRARWAVQAWSLAAQAQFRQAVGAGPAPCLAAAADAVATAAQEDKKPTQFQAWVAELWDKGVRSHLGPSQEEEAESFNKEVKVYQGGYRGIVAHNAWQLLVTHTVVFLIALVWMIAGRMLVGMGLMKLGVFAAARSRRFYVWMAVLGYGVGLPLVGYDTYALLRGHFHFPDGLRSGYLFNYVGSVPVALGHAAVVMLVCKAGALRWLTARLAAVGRMALTNYLMQSALCTTLFYGYGLGLYGKLDRTGLACVVLAVWAAELAWSPVWLRYFRFGPAEWLWRSLTYWRLQPLRRAAEPAVAEAAL
jgi:uncharacterized protein